MKVERIAGAHEATSIKTSLEIRPPAFAHARVVHVVRVHVIRTHVPDAEARQKTVAG